jgi:hypothetical protein
VVYVMEHSRAGALVQAFIRHALDQTHPEKQACECRGEEVNTDMLLRLLEADRLLGRDSVVDGLRKYTEAVIARGLDGLRKDFGDMSGWSTPMPGCAAPRTSSTPWTSRPRTRPGRARPARRPPGHDRQRRLCGGG